MMGWSDRKNLLISISTPWPRKPFANTSLETMRTMDSSIEAEMIELFLTSL
jgi:hypothetical protein